jgi:hypothetical protein
MPDPSDPAVYEVKLVKGFQHSSPVGKVTSRKSIKLPAGHEALDWFRNRPSKFTVYAAPNKAPRAHHPSKVAYQAPPLPRAGDKPKPEPTVHPTQLQPSGKKDKEPVPDFLKGLSGLPTIPQLMGETKPNLLKAARSLKIDVGFLEGDDAPRKRVIAAEIILDAAGRLGVDAPEGVYKALGLTPPSADEEVSATASGPTGTNTSSASEG